MKKHIIVLPITVIVGVLWSVFASLIWSYFVDTLFDVTGWDYANRIFTPLGWWHALRLYWAADWFSEVLLAITALGASIPFFSVGMILPWRFKGLFKNLFRVKQPSTERGLTGNHGSARIGTRDELLADFKKAPKNQGVLIGALEYKQDSPLLFDDPNNGPGHSITIAGSDGKKSTSAITRLWHYDGPRVVLDVANEIGPVMTGALRDKGYNVYSLGPGPKDHGLNILDWIDLTRPDVDSHIATATGHIFDEKGAQMKMSAAGMGSGDPTWNISARMLINCLMSHMLFTNPKFNLVALRYALMKDNTEIAAMLEFISINSKSPAAAFLAGRLKGVVASEKTWASVMFSVTAATAWMASPAYANLISGNDMKTKDILDPKTVVFVNIPMNTLLATPAIGRAVMGSLFNASIHADGVGLENRTLFELEEGIILGRMEEILLNYRASRKFGAIMHYSMQSDSDLVDVWGENGAATIRNCCSWVSYNAVRDPNSAKRLSEALSTHGVMAYSTGDNQSVSKPWGFHLPNSSQGNVENSHEIKTNLRDAGKILRSPSTTMWVMRNDTPYIAECAVAPYYLQTPIANRMDTSRFNYSKRRQQRRSLSELAETE